MGRWSEVEVMGTNNEFFNTNGFFVVKNICDVNKLKCEVPEARGQITYYGSLDKYNAIPTEEQVKGSLSRYSYPPYKSIHSEVRKEIEKVLGSELYNTYYYDRFYFIGQELTKHTDRDACEISISIHIGSNIKKSWEFELMSRKGKHEKISLNPGDGLIYAGCDVLHWREKMPVENKNIFSKLFDKKEELYYHQIFFHYVLANGYRSHHAFDMA